MLNSHIMHALGKTLLIGTLTAALGTAVILETVAHANLQASQHRTIKLVALGDSMTAASNSCGDNDYCPQTSWATGTGSTQSLAQRLQQTTGKKVLTENYAHIGDKAGALEMQVPKAIAAKADIVTILMGANDVCAAWDPTQMTSVKDYTATLNQQLRKLHEALPNVKVIIASAPDPTHLWTALHNDPAATQKWGSNVCSIALRPGVTPADNLRRTLASQQITAYNKALQHIATTNQSYVRYDGGAVHTFKYANKYISKVDYLHPNKNGQQLIAKTIWRNPALQQFLTN